MDLSIFLYSTFTSVLLLFCIIAFASFAVVMVSIILVSVSNTSSKISQFIRKYLSQGDYINPKSIVIYNSKWMS